MNAFCFFFLVPCFLIRFITPFFCFLFFFILPFASCFLPLEGVGVIVSATGSFVGHSIASSRRTPRGSRVKGRPDPHPAADVLSAAPLRPALRRLWNPLTLCRRADHPNPFPPPRHYYRHGDGSSACTSSLCPLTSTLRLAISPLLM